jgi:hypothetical protein
MPVSTPEHDREGKATKLAVEVALRNQIVDQRLDRHEARLNAFNGSLDRIEQVVSSISGKFDTQVAVAKATADKGVSARQFYLSLLGLVVSVGAILAGTGHI